MAQYWACPSPSGETAIASTDSSPGDAGELQASEWLLHSAGLRPQPNGAEPRTQLGPAAPDPERGLM